MWVNRITLDRFVYHDEAKSTIQKKLDELNITNEWITDLHISTSNGYVDYKIIVGDKTIIHVFDSGSEIAPYPVRINPRF